MIKKILTWKVFEFSWDSPRLEIGFSLPLWALILITAWVIFFKYVGA